MKHPYIIILFFSLNASFVAAQQYQYPFQNPGLPIEQRVNNIISLLTLEEKIHCLSTDPDVPRLGISGTGHVEGLHGLAQGGPAKWGPDNAPIATTQFPQAYGLGETWDPELLKQVAAIEAYETRYVYQRYKQGGLVVRAPNADLGRDPRWGRTEECFGEDAYFNGIMATSFSKGLQGDDPVYWKTAALLKHFLANSNEDGRDSSSSDFDERLWREYYSVPFREAVKKGGAQCYMASYNRYNGIPSTVHPMHKEIAMKEWGVKGIICTDGGAYKMLVGAHHYYSDLYKAGSACIKAGINQFLDDYKEGVTGAVKKGYLSEKEIDEVIKRNFFVMIKLGLLDPPKKVRYSSIGISDTIDPWKMDSHKALARLVTNKSIVLLKNEQKILPLDQSKLKSIAVIGSLANSVVLDWYSGDTSYAVTPLEGIRSAAGNGTVVSYTDKNPVELAQKSDVVILCVGNHPVCNSKAWKDCPSPSNGREAVDRKSITLEEEELIKEVYKVNKNVIVVLISSFPYAINWSQSMVPAIVHMTHNSQELGNALADVLFGKFNPGGHLTQTWPSSLEQLPAMMDYDIRHGRTYMYFRNKPLYPFGYGLSYSDFDYSDFKLNTSELKKDGSVRITVTIKNSSNREGDEVVQLYVKHLNSSVSRPLLELKGFKRITLKAWETKTVELLLNAEELTYWDKVTQKFVLESGQVECMIGQSSDKILYSGKIIVTGN
jgi:beta-glucosidase